MSQHMDALHRANEVRLARAKTKRRIEGGEVDVIEVIKDTPWEMETISLMDLLSSQHRWGRTRSRKLLSKSGGLHETKQLGTLTDRQRAQLIKGLQDARR